MPVSSNGEKGSATGENCSADGIHEDAVAVPDAVAVVHGEDEENDVEVMYTVQVKTLSGANVVSIPVNSGDTIMDVRQFLSESPETCYVTHYVLRHEGVEVSDFAEIALLVQEDNVRTATPKPTNNIKDKEASEDMLIYLTMAEGCYDERSCKAHVKRLRELMAPPQVTPASAVFALLPIAGPDGKVKTSPLDNDSQIPPEAAHTEDGISLNASSLLPLYNFDFGVDLSYKDPQCLKSITLSALNPVPSYRRLHGDLAYYDVVLSDDRVLCVTASTRGFLVNRTIPVGGTLLQMLDAAHHDSMPQIAYTLVGLLSIVSQAFKRNWAKLMQAHVARDPFESIPHHLTVTSWAALETTHAADPSRVEDSMMSCYGMETGSLPRDWNEEHQSCRELPMENRRERILRERTMFKISSDFVEAATKGAVAVIDRCIQPINPMDAPSAHMYVYNNIFFSYATPTKEETVAAAEAAGEEGLGDQATYASSNQDLIGVQLYSSTETSGLYTLATAVVDYRGYRIVAQVKKFSQVGSLISCSKDTRALTFEKFTQSIIPGILQGEQLGSLIYGSVDNGSKFVWNEEFHQKLSKAAAQLHIKKHQIEDGTGTQHEVCVPVECKGILGSDNRR